MRDNSSFVVDDESSNYSNVQKIKRQNDMDTLNSRTRNDTFDFPSLNGTNTFNTSQNKEPRESLYSRNLRATARMFGFRE
jgi:hypothetical protein